MRSKQASAADNEFMSDFPNSTEYLFTRRLDLADCGLAALALKTAKPDISEINSKPSKNLQFTHS